MTRSFLLFAAALLLVLSGDAAARAADGADVGATPGLVAYWAFDERSGAPHEALTGAAMTTIGAPASGAMTARSDDRGGALRLDGSSAVRASGVAGHTGAFSIEAWVRPQARRSTRYIVSRGTSSTSAYHLALDRNDRLVLTLGTAAGHVSVAGGTARSGAWHHVAATVENGTAVLYVNGAETARAAVTPAAVADATTLFAGRYSRSSSSFWLGDLDEVAVYSSALAADVIRARHAAVTAGPAPATRLSRTPAGLTNRSDATFAFAGSKTGLTFACQLDGGAAFDCSGGAQLSALADGAHTLTARATDRYGVVESRAASFTWRVDRTPPETLLLVAKPAANGAATMGSFTSEAGATFECRLGNGAWYGCESPKAIPSASAGTPFTVRAIDGAGNADASPATAVLTADSGSAGPGSFAYSRAAFDVAGARSASSLQCRLNEGDWTACPASLTFENLGPGAYSIQVRDQHLAGLASTSLRWEVALPTPRLIGASFPAVLSLGTKKAQRKKSAKRLPRMLFQSNAAAVATFELRRGKKLVRRWTAPAVRGSNAAVLPRAAWLKLRPGRYRLTATATNASGRSTVLQRRFDAVRGVRR